MIELDVVDRGVVRGASVRAVMVMCTVAAAAVASACGAAAGPDSAAAAGAGRWRIERGVRAPWAGEGSGQVPNARLHGSRIEFAADRVNAPAPLGCANVVYELVVTPAEGLFQGALVAQAATAAGELGLAGPRTMTLRVQCDDGVFDFHYAGADTLVFGLDNAIWTMVAEPQPNAPELTLIALLVEHMPGDMGFLPDLVRPKQRLFSPELNAAIQAYFAHPWPADEPPPISGDPFTDSQEHPSRALLGSLEISGDRASLGVVFKDEYRERPITVLLRRLDGHWLIDDLRYDDGGTLQEMLAAR